MICQEDEELNLHGVPGKVEQIQIEELGARIRPARGRKGKGRKRVYIEGYTKREVERAIRARRLYHCLTAPDLQELKGCLRQML